MVIYAIYVHVSTYALNSDIWESFVEMMELKSQDHLEWKQRVLCTPCVQPVKNQTIEQTVSKQMSMPFVTSQKWPR